MSISDVATRAMEHLRSNSKLSRFGTQYVFDAIAWVAAIFFALVLRYDFDLVRIPWRWAAILCLVTVLVQLASGWLLFLYRGRHRYGSFAEIRELVFSILIVGVLVGVTVSIVDHLLPIPRSTIIFAGPIAFMLMGVVPYIKRLLVERSFRPHAETQRALVYGAGYLGASVVRRMHTDQHSPYAPVGLIEDDRLKRHRWFDGVHVLGAGKDLVSIAQETNAQMLVVSIARAGSELLRTISDAAAFAHLKVKVFPPARLDKAMWDERCRIASSQSIEEQPSERLVHA